MDHTMGNKIAQQQMMSTRCKMSRQVNQDLEAGVFSSKITIATSAHTCSVASLQCVCVAAQSQGPTHTEGFGPHTFTPGWQR